MYVEINFYIHMIYYANVGYFLRLYYCVKKTKNDREHLTPQQQQKQCKKDIFVNDI